ncbi:5683_t:CDS:1, partial [Gigaspora margarita]
PPKALNICKLKAAITWEHLRRSNPIELFLSSFHDFTENNKELSKEPKELSEELEELSEESDEFADPDIENYKASELTPLEEFRQFLDIWVDILTSEIEEITQIYEDKNEMLTSEIEDIDHLALDSKAKWDLRTLFNNELQ